MVEETFNYKIIKNKNKEWIVLIHGFGGSSLTWKNQINFFKDKYNLLIFDMHKNNHEKISFESICKMINKSLIKEKIKKAHFIGFSFSTLICLKFGQLYTKKVSSLSLGGGIIKFDYKTRFLINIALILEKFVSHTFIYKTFAYIIMPKKNHKRSRNIFIREAKKLDSNNFKKWLHLIPSSYKSDVWLNEIKYHFPIVYIMGEQDHLFKKHTFKLAKKLNIKTIEIIKAGHVCSIENYKDFNDALYNFIINS